MKVIGVCGGSGSGKGEVCRLFLELGIPSLDTDALYHDMISHPCECTKALSLRFGNEILDENGAVLRERLAKIVFAKGAESALSDLNRIAHYYILNGIRLWVQEKKKEGCSAALVDAPLLFESGFDKECDRILCVTAPMDVRIGRITLRDGISIDRAKARIDSQIKDDELIKKCDLHIRNAGDLAELKQNVLDTYNIIMQSEEKQ